MKSMWHDIEWSLLIKQFFEKSAISQKPYFNNVEVRAHAELFCQKDFFKNFAKLTRKHLYWYLFLNKICRVEKSGLQLY